MQTTDNLITCQFTMNEAQQLRAILSRVSVMAVPAGYMRVVMDTSGALGKALDGRGVERLSIGHNLVAGPAG